MGLMVNTKQPTLFAKILPLTVVIRATINYIRIFIINLLCSIKSFLFYSSLHYQLLTGRLKFWIIFTKPLTSSRLSWLSLSASISLKTFVVGAESPMLISSTSNNKVAPPGITLPAPRSPYPRLGGMMSFLFSPTHMSTRPWSHPLITCPTPSWKENGWSRSRL